jgi:hypothetical protein
VIADPIDGDATAGDEHGIGSLEYAYEAAGAPSSANLYSLVATCRANEIEPYWAI